MGKHSKNNCALPYYTNAERLLDAKRQGYGTQSVRLGKDSFKDFDACSLTLHPCREPVITPDGHIFEKEAIYESILHQKTDIARKLKAYDEEMAREKRQMEERQEQEARRVLDEFEKTETSVSVENTIPGKKFKIPTVDDVRVTWDANQTKLTRNFWIPAMTPEAKQAKLERPDTNVYCPVSGKKLRLKDLTPVKFTPIDSTKSLDELLVRKERWICPVTRAVLTNSTPCAVLRPTGVVVTMDAVDNVIKKDMREPLTGDLLIDADIIPIARTGTGYAGAGVDLTPKTYRPAQQAS